MEKPMEGVVQEIRSLAKRNKFKDIVKILSDLVHKYDKSPHHLIAVLTLRIFYNLQLNANQSIVSDFNMIKSPYNEKWMYESYPDKYGDKRGSMCPFSLNLLYAYYPYLVGSVYTSLDRFHVLWEYLMEQRHESREAADVFTSRIICVGLLVADIFVSEQRPQDALSILLRLHSKHNASNHATSAMLAVVYNMIGDSVNANKHIERAMEETSQFTEHYRGIHCVINADFEQAHHQFTVCKNSYEAQETSTVVNSCENTTINNIAVSLFYMSRTVAAKNAIDSCLNIYKHSKLFKGIIWNSTMLKELAVDIDTSYLDDDTS